MFKPVHLLIGAFALISTNLAFAKADAEPVTISVTTLRIMENNRPPILVDLSGFSPIVIGGDFAHCDSAPGSLTQTTIFEGKAEVTATNMAGTKYSYKTQNGTMILTKTSVKAAQPPQPKAAQSPKA